MNTSALLTLNGILLLVLLITLLFVLTKDGTMKKNAGKIEEDIKKIKEQITSSFLD
ncbi:MAG: hypothetical protein AABX73_03505 [Nanoarchaeota archaeon]